MNVLVTGGAGFIGSHLTERLLRAGVRVTVVDNLQTGVRENVPEGAAFVEMDICSDNLGDVFKQEQFDAVVHLAGQTMVSVSVIAPDYDANVNIQGTINVLESCRKNGVKRIVFASTAAVYGDVDLVPITETFDPQPTSFYGLSKLTVERYLQLYQALYEIDYVALRFSNVYGERQGDGGEGGVISIFAKKVAGGDEISIFGDGKQTRDFIYAGDVANGIWHALQTGNVNEVYNLSTKTEVSVNEVVGLLAEISGKKILPKYGPARSGDIYRSVLANDKIARELQWMPEVPLREGLGKTYQYFYDKLHK